MYEVEIKIEISESERGELMARLEAEGFVYKGKLLQEDFYVKAEKSILGGQDLIRYRNENGKYIYAEKIWVDFGGQKVRREVEHEVSEEEFKKGTQTKIITFKKSRDYFTGRYKGENLNIDIDTVKFEHSSGERFFVEAEVLVSEEEKVIKTRELVFEFLKMILKKDEIKESPGMFKMANERL